MLHILKNPITLVVLLIVTTIAWFGIPRGTSPTGQKIVAQKEAPATNVMVQAQKSEKYIQKLQFTGAVHALETTDLISEVEGYVEVFLTPKGQAVKKGTPLLKISTENRVDDLKAAKAALQEAALHRKSMLTLLRQGLGSDALYKQARTAYLAAKAQYEKARNQVENSIIRAPYDGVVDHYSISKGSHLDPNGGGNKVGVFIQTTPLTMHGYVDQFSVAKARQGQPAHIMLANGHRARGKVTYIAPVADEKTRTYKIEITFPNTKGKVPVGMSAEATIDVAVLKAHPVHPSTFVLGEEGDIGVMLLSGDNTAQFYPIHMLASDSKTTWVTGLPDEIQLITTGQALVKAGSKVVPTSTAAKKG